MIQNARASDPGLGPMLCPGGTEEWGPGKWWSDTGVRNGHWLAAVSGVGTEGHRVSHLPAREEAAGSLRRPRWFLLPLWQREPPRLAWSLGKGGGQYLPKAPLTRKAKVAGTIPPFHAGRPGRSALELTEGGSPSQAAQDKQGGRKFPRSQGWRPGASQSPAGDWGREEGGASATHR